MIRSLGYRAWYASRAVYWAARRAEKRAAKRLIERLIARYHWHNTILNTDIPNVPFLKCEEIVVRNGYGQTHRHEFKA